MAFRMKVHIGVDSETGVVHSVSTTPANVHDVRETPRLLHGGETQVWGDAGYLGVSKREENRDMEVEWQVAMRPGQRRKLEPGSHEAAAGETQSLGQSQGGASFPVGEAALRLRQGPLPGLAKNTQRLMMLLGFANLITAEQYLAA